MTPSRAPATSAELAVAVVVIDVVPPGCEDLGETVLVEPGTGESPVQRIDVLGGLIHEYRRAA
jgi:hypothetical protein